VHHLDYQRDVSRRLGDLHVIVIGPRRHRWPGIEAEDAAVRQRSIEISIRTNDAELLVSRDCSLLVELLLRVRGQRRDAPIRRIDDERGALVADDLAAALVPELVVGDDAAGQILQTAFLGVDQIAVLSLVLFALEDSGFFVGQCLFVGEAARALERSDRAEVLHPFEVVLPVRQPWWRPIRLRRSSLPDECDATTEHKRKSQQR
jgi:hypothetical protein